MYINAPGGIIQALDATNGDLSGNMRASIKDVSAGASRSKSLGIYEDMIFLPRPTASSSRLTRSPKGSLGNPGELTAARPPAAFRRGRQGADQPHLRTGQARKLLHRRARRQDRQGALEILHHRGARRARRRHLGDVPLEQRAAGPWGLPGSYDPKRKITYWASPNPNPYTRLTRHNGKADRVPLTERRSSSTATPPCARHQIPASLSGIIRNCPADDWTPTTITNSFSSAPSSTPTPNTLSGSAPTSSRAKSAKSWSRLRKARNVRGRTGDGQIRLGAGPFPMTCPTST